MTDTALVADDDAIFRSQLVRRLEAAGYRTVACADAAQVSQALDQVTTLHAAVLDMRLGDDNGLALVPDIKARFPDCRVVMLTGYGSIPTAVEATRLGAMDYLTKPVDAGTLISTLKGKQTGTVPLPQGPPSLARIEWDHIQRVLLEHDGNVSSTARALGIDRRTLQRKLQKRPSPAHFRRDRDG